MHVVCADGEVFGLEGGAGAVEGGADRGSAEVLGEEGGVLLGERVICEEVETDQKGWCWLHCRKCGVC